MRLLSAVLLLLPAVAWAAPSNPDSRGGAAACPLSEKQTHDSIDTFQKFVPILQNEPRCANCHGGVNPFIDGVGNAADPKAAHVAHGGEKREPESDCSDCHDTLEPKTNGEPSIWKIAPPFMGFGGKEAPELCKQIKMHSRRCENAICGPWPDAEKFIGHVTDDEGHDNFTATAFRGMRGLNPADYPEIKPEPPKGITAAGLVALGREWVRTTGGKFHGDDACGCEPAEYAIRISAATEFNNAGVAFKSELPPLDVPIKFKDDGTFTGTGIGVFKASSQVAGRCDGQSATSLDFNLSGKAVQNADEQSLHLRIETTTASTTLDVQCRPVGNVSTQNTAANRTDMEFDLVGDVGEYADYVMAPPMPGFKSSARIQLVRVK